MTIQRIIKAAAADPKQGMTLAELAVFVQSALREDADDDMPVRVIANMRGGIKRLETRA